MNVPSDIREDIDAEIGFEDYILEKISLLKNSPNVGVVDNPAGWLVKAIRENWTHKPGNKRRVRRDSGYGKVVSVADLLEGKRFPKTDSHE